jgi:N-acetylglucosaminyldiphosphoundecaprenol N-acetyl-beta-D-mannosaminyltransferase
MQVSPPRANVLGVGISAIDMSAAVATVRRWICSGEHHYVCVTGVHGVMECQRDDALRRIHNSSGLTTPDGMPLVWLSRLLGFGHVERVYGPDLMLALCEESQRSGYRHFLYGGGEGVADLLEAKLRDRFPGLKVVGTYTPPFRALTQAEDAALVASINSSGADIVWIGLSTPKQERWMAEHLGRIEAPVMVGVGAAFDFHSGAKRQAPKWMQRSGLEWLFRFTQEPKRLWQRYLINNPQFLACVVLQLLGARAYPDVLGADVSTHPVG